VVRAGSVVERRRKEAKWCEPCDASIARETLLRHDEAEGD
jgi:hypothetical protein